MLIIGLVGKKRHGKTTCAKYLENEYRFKRYAFARPLKTIVCNIVFGTKWNEEMDDTLKKSTELIAIDFDELVSRLNAILKDNKLPLLSEDEYSLLQELAQKQPCSQLFRRALQIIGTEIFRKRDESFWIAQLIKSISLEPSTSKIVVEDVRFMNEFDVLRDRNAFMIGLVNLNENSSDKHASERFIDLLLPMCDKVIKASTVQELLSKLTRSINAFMMLQTQQNSGIINSYSK